MSFNRPSALIGAVATAATAAASYWIYQSVSQYGWDGTLRYVWEGDPYSPHVRASMETMEQAEQARHVLETLISTIEEALERARLDSIDDAASTKEIGKLWMANFAPSNLETSLTKLSYTLDKLAAKVDGVLVAGGDQHSSVQQDLKRRKKLLSKQIVLAMERADALLAAYEVLQETQ
jgi:hypothetical protein